MGVLGLAGGTIAGKELGKAVGSDIVGDIASSVLGGLGALLPIGFENGGEVKQTGKALVHKGEYVLPKGVRPTKSQMKEVNKRKKQAKKVNKVSKKKVYKKNMKKPTFV